MASIVECLGCGRLRAVHGSTGHALGAGQCPRCGYVGWAVSAELTEAARRDLRDVPVERRRHAGPPLRPLALR